MTTTHEPTATGAPQQGFAPRPETPTPMGPHGRRADMTNVAREHGFEPLRVEGTLPRELRGTLYRAGPGLFETFGVPVDHSFEADGAISAVRLDGAGGAEGAIRVVASEGLLEERRAGKPLYYSRASAPRRLLNGLTMRLKNTANTSVLSWRGRLFALVEAGLPTEIAPGDLSTLGATDLGGALRRTLGAHPHPVVSRRATYDIGVEYGPRSGFHLVELPWEGPARVFGFVPLKKPVMLHDFVATEKHLVFLVSPVRLELFRVLFGLTRFGGYFGWHPEDGTEIIVVPIDAPERVTRFRVDPFFQWHFAGAWEDGEQIAMCFARYPDFASYGALGNSGLDQQGELVLARVDPARERFTSERLWGPCDFPRIDPRREGARYTQAFVTSVGDGRRALARVDVERGAGDLFVLDRAQLASELIYVPKGDDAAEGEGYALSYIFDSRTTTSHLAVFDALRMCDGPIARCHFREHVPMTFHGTWVASD